MPTEQEVGFSLKSRCLKKDFMSLLIRVKSWVLPLVQQHVKEEVNEDLIRTEEHQDEQLLVHQQSWWNWYHSVACSSDVCIFKGLVENYSEDVYVVQGI